jgi:hypothetical protein
MALWIVAAGTEITQDVLDQAAANGCGEIARGIPPRLAGQFSPEDLPCVYEAPQRPVVPRMFTHWARILEMNPGQERPLRVQRTYRGEQFTVRCYVTKDLVDLYQAGELAVGDFVLVMFVDGDRNQPLATQKVYKSW